MQKAFALFCLCCITVIGLAGCSGDTTSIDSAIKPDVIIHDWSDVIADEAPALVEPIYDNNLEYEGHQFSLNLSDIQYYEVIESEENTKIKIYELKPHTTELVCGFTISSTKPQDVYLEVDNLYISRIIYTKEVELCLKQ